RELSGSSTSSTLRLFREVWVSPTSSSRGRFSRTISTEGVGEARSEEVPKGTYDEVPVNSVVFFLAFLAYRSLACALVISTAKQKFT
ncbi:hypothetical protein A2U01_0076244, partial [Trifolium medium]|nr:hypothetical protein [Trifolium medium]